MTTALFFLAAFLALLLALTSFVQLLYLEALRLRPREQSALEFFKETLEDRLGLKLEAGALVFSLIKHSSLLALGIVIAAIVALRSGPFWLFLVEAGLSAWFTVLAASYIVPQLLYRRTSGRWLLPLVPLLRALALLVSPLAGILRFLHSLLELGGEKKTEEESSNSGEEFAAFISAGAEEGLIEEDDRKLIHSVVAFGDKTVREVMTPRPSIVSIPQDAPLEELRNLVVHEQFSRIPVHGESIDDILGFVHVRDMFELDYAERSQRKVSELMRPIRYVPETKPVDDLFREMQNDGVHMSIVIDEYGNTAGLATMEDLVEEILGEIRDEHEPALDVIRDSEDSYIVSGSLDLDRLHELLGYRPQQETESTTVGGLVTEWLGRVPRVGETIERDGIRIDIMAGSERRVGQVRISRIVQQAGENSGK